MKTRNRWMTVVIALASSAAVQANQLREEPLQERIDGADLIVVGTTPPVEEVDKGSAARSKYARIQVQQVIKGTAEPVIEVLVEDPFIEAQPDCCEAGATYLMFLERDRSGRFVSVNGRFGIYQIDSANAAKAKIQSVDSVVALEQQLVGQSIIVRGFLRFGTDSKNLWNDSRAYAAVVNNWFPPDHPAWNRCITLYDIVGWRDFLIANSNMNVVVTGVLRKETREPDEINLDSCSELGVSITSVTK